MYFIMKFWSSLFKYTKNGYVIPPDIIYFTYIMYLYIHIIYELTDVDVLHSKVGQKGDSVHYIPYQVGGG